jgi:hypothetical protein
MLASLVLFAALALDIPPEPPPTGPGKGCSRTDASLVILSATALLAAPLLLTRKRQPA